MQKIFLTLIILSNPAFGVAQEVKLDELGLTKEEVSVDPQIVKANEKRVPLLKTHTILGLSTLALMTATMLTGGHEGTSSSGHQYLGIASGVSYLATATTAYLAPKPEAVGEEKGQILWHKRLAFIHFPAMLIGPTLGYIYRRNTRKGKDSSGFVKNHSTFAKIGFWSYLASTLVLAVEF